jgi:hypothetical protein
MNMTTLSLEELAIMACFYIKKNRKLVNANGFMKNLISRLKVH